MNTKQDMGEKFHGVLFNIGGVLEFQDKACRGAAELLGVLKKRGVIF